MFTNKLSKLFLGIVVVALTLVTVSFVEAPKARESYPDYALRHPGEVIIPVTAGQDAAASDYFQRHPELTMSSLLGQDASDYFQRHPELTAPSVLGQAAPDYFQRHPELIAPAEASLDTTDYFFRHLELQGSSISDRDMTDYFFRHLSH